MQTSELGLLLPKMKRRKRNHPLNSPLALFVCCQSPNDYYQVGTMVEFSCVEGFYLSGDAVAECTENQTWRRGPMVCQSMSSAVSLFDLSNSDTQAK